MTDPLKLAELLESANSRLEKPGDVRFFTFEIETEDFALVAAALRLAEAGCDADSFIDYNIRFTWCRVCDADLSSPRDLPHEGHKDDCAYYAYRAAREGR